jgi:hypothetical protein
MDEVDIAASDEVVPAEHGDGGFVDRGEDCLPVLADDADARAHHAGVASQAGEMVEVPDDQAQEYAVLGSGVEIMDRH